MPEQKAPSASDLQDSYEGIGGFLRGLMDAFKTGAKGTVDALRDDWTDILERTPPHNLMRDLPGLLSMLGSPSVNPTIPALQYTRMTPAAAGAGQVLESKVYPGGDALAAYLRSGTANPVLEEMFKRYEQAQAYNAPPMAKAK